MTIQETANLLKRIKQHYQDFIIDEYKVEEWHSELKNYDANDVNKKLEEHLRNEQFGRAIPKVYFLTKYLKTTKEKEKIENRIEFVYCPLCKEEVRMSDFDKHYDRCCSVDYFIRQYEKYFGKKLSREQLMNMEQEKFDINYEKLLKHIQKSTTDEIEFKLVGYYFNPPKQVNISEVLQ